MYPCQKDNGLMVVMADCGVKQQKKMEEKAHRLLNTQIFLFHLSFWVVENTEFLSRMFSCVGFCFVSFLKE